jgi:hypothetical protein
MGGRLVAKVRRAGDETSVPTQAFLKAHLNTCIQ